MQFIDLISSINPSLSQQMVRVNLIALRSDPVIWRGVTEIPQNSYALEYLRSKQKVLNPGTLAEAYLEIDSKKTMQGKTRFAPEFLERLFLLYENYIQDPTPALDFKCAAELAIGLVEKNKVGHKWSEIIADIINRMNLKDSATLVKYWGSVFGIIINLIEDKDALLSAMLDQQNPLLVLDLFIHVIRCLVTENVEKVEILHKHLEGTKPSLQALFLRKLKPLVDNEVLSQTAQRLEKKYLSIDLQPQYVNDYWDHLEGSLSFALKLQAIAEIAAFAGDEPNSQRFNKKSVEALDAISAIAKIHQTELRRHDEPAISWEDNLSPEVTRELLYANVEIAASEGDRTGSVLNALQRAKRMQSMGNNDLAQKELRDLFIQLSDGEIRQVILSGPKFATRWDPQEVVDLLVKLQCHNEALRVVRLLLEDKPADMRLNQIAFDLTSATDEKEDALSHAQLLFDLDPQNPVVQKSLSKAYAKNADYQNALRVSKLLLEGNREPAPEDQLQTAGYCLKVGEYEAALTYLLTALNNNPEDARALTLAGTALKNLGENQKSMDYLERAVLLEGGDPEAWLLLSDLYWQNGNKQAGLQKLKEGIAATPGHADLEFAYALKLIDTGAVADAFPLLRSLSERESTLEVDLVLLDVMKQMGAPELLKVAEGISEKYPDNSQVSAVLGTILVNAGKHKEALAHLKDAKVNGSLNTNSQIAYLQSLVHWNYREFKYQPVLTRPEFLEAFSIVDQLKANENENGLVALIEAEILLAANENSVAFEKFSALMKSEELNLRDWFLHRNTGLAISAREVAKFDLAEAAIHEVLEVEPEFTGIKRIAAEIYALNDKNELSTDVASSIYEAAAEDAEVVSWYADLLRKNGQEDKAEIIVSKAIARNSRNLSLVLNLAEPRWLSGEQERAIKGLEAIKPLLAKCESVSELIRTARGFATVSDQGSVELCLQQAAGLDGLGGTLNLAGYHREKGEMEKCQSLLISKQNEDPLVSILLAEVMSADGNDEEALRMLEPIKDNGFRLTPDSNFYPKEWKRLINAQSPGLELQMSILIKKGKYSDAASLAINSLASQYGSPETRATTIECALGAGQKELVDQLLAVEPTLLIDPSASYYRMLWNERALDNKDIALVKVISTDNELGNETLFDRITNIRLNHLGGDLASAEEEFQEILENWKLVEQCPLIQKFSLLRNLFKAAQELNRWSDVVWLITNTIGLFTGHQSLFALAFQLLVRALEFGNRFENMDVKTHTIQSTDSEILRKLFGELLSNSDNLNIEDREKWTLRGKLAINPEQGSIRALATLTPEPEDAAALMSALRRGGQSEIVVKVARKFHKDPIVLFELARAETDLQKSIAAVNSVLDIEPENPLAYWLLSDLLITENNKQDAIRAREVALSYWPNESEWQVKTADLWADLGNIDKQVEHLQVALQFSPKNDDLHATLGKALVAVHELDKGLEHLRTAVGINPNRSDVWTSIAEAHEAAGDLEEAIVAAQKAAEMDPFSTVPLLTSARIHLTKGESAQAITDAERAVEIDPSNADGYLLLSKLHLEQGDKQSALLDLEKASNSRNATLHTMVRHAQLLKELSGPEASRGLLDEFSKRYPENPDLLKYLAEAENECGNLEYAQSVARRALELQPENAELHRLFGKIQEKSGNLDQAALSYGKSIAYDPQSVDGYVDLSHAFYTQREYCKAREVLEQGIERNPREIRLLIVLANISRESKDYTLAEEMLRRASEIEPRNLDVHRQLGAVLALNMIHQSQEASVQS